MAIRAPDGANKRVSEIVHAHNFFLLFSFNRVKYVLHLNFGHVHFCFAAMSLVLDMYSC